MSLAVKPIATHVCIDPRINFHPNYEYVIHKSGSYTLWTTINAVTVSQSALTFTNLAPSQRTIYDKVFYLKCRLSIAISGVNATPGTTIEQLGVHDSLKYKPLHTQIISTETVTLNNTSVSINPIDVASAMFRCGYHKDIDRYGLSITPSSIQDAFQNYEDFENPAYPYFSQYSMNNNPMGPVGQGWEDGRGGFVLVSRTKIDDNNSILVYDITEPLMVSPFMYKNDRLEQGFTGLNNININLTLASVGLGGGLWSHSSYGNTLNSVVATVQSAAILIQQINPPVTQILPRGIILYPYDEVSRYPTSVGIIAAGATQAGVQSNNIQLNSIPSLIYIFARRDPSTVTFNTTDTFAGLSNVNVTFQIKNNLLGSQDQRQLYEMCVENGFVGSWSAASRDSGLICVIDPNKDLALDDDQAAGMLDQIQLQIRADVTNLNQSHAINFQFMIVIVNPGCFSIDVAGSTCASQIGIISKMDVINSSMLPLVNYHQIKSIYGGDIKSTLQKFGQNIASFAKQAAPIVAPFAKTAAKAALAEVLPGSVPFLEMLGIGEGEGEGGRLRHRRRRIKHRY